MRSGAIPGLDRPYLIAEFHDPARSDGRYAVAVDGLKAQGHKWASRAEEVHNQTGITVLVLALPGHHSEEEFEHSTALQYILGILSVLWKIHRQNPREVQLWGFSAGAAVMVILAGLFPTPPSLLFLAAPPFRPRLTPDVTRLYGYRRKLNSLSAVQVFLGAVVVVLWGMLGFMEIYAQGLFERATPYLQSGWFRSGALLLFLFGCAGYFFSQRTRRDVQLAFGRVLQEFVSIFQLLALLVVGGAAFLGFASSYLPEVREYTEPLIRNPLFKFGGLGAIIILTATVLAIQFRKRTGLRARIPFESTSKDSGDCVYTEYPYYPFVTGKTALSLPTLFFGARILFGWTRLRGIKTVIALGDRDEVIDNDAVMTAVSPSDKWVRRSWLRYNRENQSVTVRLFQGIPHSVMNHPAFDPFLIEAVTSSAGTEGIPEEEPVAQTA